MTDMGSSQIPWAIHSNLSLTRQSLTVPLLIFFPLFSPPFERGKVFMSIDRKKRKMLKLVLMAKKAGREVCRSVLGQTKMRIPFQLIDIPKISKHKNGK